MHGEGEKLTSMHRVRIIDAKALQTMLGEVKARFGSHGKAARWLGIEKHTFTRLLNGTTSGAMSYKTYASILEALGGKAAEFWLEPDPILGFGFKPSDLVCYSLGVLVGAFTDLLLLRAQEGTPYQTQKVQGGPNRAEDHTPGTRQKERPDQSQPQ